MPNATWTLYHIAKEWAKDRGKVAEHLESLALAYFSGEFDGDAEPVRRALLGEIEYAIANDESFERFVQDWKSHFSGSRTTDISDEQWLIWMGCFTRYDDLPPLLQFAAKQVELHWPALRDWCASKNLCPPLSILNAVASGHATGADLPSDASRKGRPRAHSYESIDLELAHLLERQGFPAFSKISSVVRHLEQVLGRDNLPPDSTLRSHIKAWLARQKRRLIVPESAASEADRPR